MFQIKSATAAELEAFGNYFLDVTTSAQVAGVSDLGEASKLTVHRARRILIGFMTRENAGDLGREIARAYLAGAPKIKATDVVETPLSRLSHE